MCNDNGSQAMQSNLEINRCDSKELKHLSLFNSIHGKETENPGLNIHCDKIILSCLV